MDQGGRPSLAGEARRRVVETRVEERARGCCDQPEGLLGVAVVDHRDVVGKCRQLPVDAADRRPIGAKMEFPVGMGKAVEKMTGRKGRAAIEPTVFREALDIRQSARPQGPVDQLDGAQLEAGVARAEPLGETANHLMVRAALGIGRQDRAAQLQIGVGAAEIDVVMLEEGCRRQDDVGHCRGFSHELLVDADEEIGTRKAALDQPRLRCHDQRVGVLDQ